MVAARSTNWRTLRRIPIEHRDLRPDGREGIAAVDRQQGGGHEGLALPHLAPHHAVEQVDVGRVLDETRGRRQRRLDARDRHGQDRGDLLRALAQQAILVVVVRGRRRDRETQGDGQAEAHDDERRQPPPPATSRHGRSVPHTSRSLTHLG